MNLNEIANFRQEMQKFRNIIPPKSAKMSAKYMVPTCQDTRLLRFSTIIRYLERVGGPYLSNHGARLKQ